jgi:hypothetical protein
VARFTSVNGVARRRVGRLAGDFIAPVNHIPTDIFLSNDSVAENKPVGTTAGFFTAADSDATDTHAFELVSGAGDADNSSFTIDANALKTAAVFDYEAKSNYSIRVRATDSGGLTFEKTFNINISGMNEAPYSVEPLTPATSNYGTAFSYTVPAGAFADPDFGQNLSLTASGLPLGLTFDPITRTISGAPATVGVFTVLITATDDGVPSLGTSSGMTITVSPAPLVITAGNQAKMYGSANPVLTASVSGFQFGEDASVLSGTLVISTAANTASPVGNYPITASGLSSPLYAITYAPGTLTVTPTMLVVAADNLSRVFGTANATFTGAVSGLQ